MIQCIVNNKGAIGYLESGRGWAELKEIQLLNKGGFYISSQNASTNNGITSAGFNKTLPSSFDEDFGGVEFLDEVIILGVFLRSSSISTNLCRI
jgi:hypothetical protein